MRDAERSIISYALECGGSITKAAELLGISVPYMSERTHELGIIAPAPAKRGRPLGPIAVSGGAGLPTEPEEPEEGVPGPKSEAKPPRVPKPRVPVDGRPSTERGQPSCSPAFVVVQGGEDGGVHEDEGLEGEDLEGEDLEDEDDEDEDEGDEDESGDKDGGKDDGAA